MKAGILGVKPEQFEEERSGQPERPVGAQVHFAGDLLPFEIIGNTTHGAFHPARAQVPTQADPSGLLVHGGACAVAERDGITLHIHDGDLIGHVAGKEVHQVFLARRCEAFDLWLRRPAGEGIAH